MASRTAKRGIAVILGLMATLLVAVVWVWSLSLHSPAMQWRWQARWLFSSGRYKAEVLAQQRRKGGYLRHVEWDSWGWAGEDTTVYLVFDPDNALAQAARGDHAGKYPGIPCKVPQVRRLASQWYAVLFYTDTDWDHCS